MNYSNSKGNAASDRSEELTAATALAGLAINNDRDDDTAAASHHKDEETAVSFVIPQRFTKSGRQRAVPFPLKVCTKKHGTVAVGEERVFYAPYPANSYRTFSAFGIRVCRIRRFYCW